VAVAEGLVGARARADPVSGSSPAVGEEEKGAPGVPTVGEGGGAVPKGGR
jgi:hypothetical protein